MQKHKIKVNIMKQDISKSIEACAAHYGEQADAMRTYLVEGEKQALIMSNRGPLRFDAGGNLAQDIQDAYFKYGFYYSRGCWVQRSCRP